ncbi:glutaredoxin-like protein C5orf63 homolog [Diadema setosum]|uniref:glutaredoxin-like protein C5orf63 homolog n=1 Tax=Diadema setosum TaxID=31175 RepID=UPI003B3A714A
MYFLFRHLLKPGLYFRLTYTRKCSSQLPVLTLYTKDPCSLCDDAKGVLQKFSDKLILEEVDITASGNEEWKRLYQYDIPVFHYNGKYLMRHRVDEELLMKRLAEKSII